MPSLPSHCFSLFAIVLVGVSFHLMRLFSRSARPRFCTRRPVRLFCRPLYSRPLRLAWLGFACCSCHPLRPLTRANSCVLHTVSLGVFGFWLVASLCPASAFYCTSATVSFLGAVIGVSLARPSSAPVVRLKSARQDVFGIWWVLLGLCLVGALRLSDNREHARPVPAQIAGALFCWLRRAIPRPTPEHPRLPVHLFLLFPQVPMFLALLLLASASAAFSPQPPRCLLTNSG